MSGTTLSNIARALGYSKNTISLALRDDPQIPAVTRDKIKATAEKLGYRPNAVVAHLMAQLRSARTSRLQAKLALVNANLDRGAFKDHPTIPIYVEGCERRAHSLGYDFDRFWLHDPELTAERWIRILTARGIKGLILVGLMDTNHLPANLEAVWRRFPCVVTGVRTRDPALSFCCVDHYDLALTAFEQALQLGYQRPGLVLDDVIDALVERRFSAGYMAAQRRTTRSQRIPVFGDVAGPDRSDMFRSWLDRHEPDVRRHGANGRGVAARLQRRLVRRGAGAGMNQHNRVTGEAAVDMVVSQIHNNEAGIQEFPRSTMIGATWVGGGTVRSRDTPAQVPRARARKKA